MVPPARPGAIAGTSVSVAFAVLCVGVAIGGCANGAERDEADRMDDTDIPLPGTFGERGAWFDLRLGESRATVLAALGGQASSPRCTYSRLAPEGARRTFPMERCGHDAAILDPPRPALDELVTYFIDETLVRVDATFSPSLAAAEDERFAALRARLDRDLGSVDVAGPAGVREPDGAGEAGPDTWTVGRDRVRLFPGSPDPGGQGTPARLALYDARVALTLPQLGDEAP